ncbi:hypothetical protein [Arhodomonas sp. AD133]|uniref:hypothetical protein n=1 Tax=Arhodomonas sp. AD133 TaxID=3415009 RepID=UPI003EBDD15D
MFERQGDDGSVEQRGFGKASLEFLKQELETQREEIKALQGEGRTSNHAQRNLKRLNETLGQVTTALKRSEATAATAATNAAGTVQRLDEERVKIGDMCVASVDLNANVQNRTGARLTATASAAYTDFGPMVPNVKLYANTWVKDSDGETRDSDSETVYGDAYGPGANAESTLLTTFSRDGYAFAMIHAKPCN